MTRNLLATLAAVIGAGAVASSALAAAPSNTAAPQTSGTVRSAGR